jgi:hypothetical protein
MEEDEEEDKFYMWLYCLELQILTDELKDDIMDKVQELVLTLKSK